ncbi:hypothetical protein [Tahibacter caeni]|uniref:hypothetical protein n=1 Tax=Tahibacter caeni TaxID=1453545 RepID=UPI002147F3F7|nr:hypothetical protein [Tahibacter caeni]
MDPQRFDSALREVLQEREADIVAHWNPPVTPFTALMQRGVLPETGRRLGLLPHPQEYYSLDCVYVAGYDTKRFAPGSGYAKAFSVILEHENDGARSCEEMSKLLLFNAPLKVLITYARAGQGLERLLACYTGMIEDSGNAALAASSQRILVVFGDKPDDTPTWRSYLYERNGFSEITPALP